MLRCSSLITAGCFQKLENGNKAAEETSMTDADALIQRIRANAALVVSVAAKEVGTSIGYDQVGVEWLNGYIQRQHEQGDPGERNGLVQTLGSYLGECIVHSLGGEWASANGTWAIRFDAGNAAFPFAKVRKHLDRGADDSVLGFYKSVAVLFRTTEEKL
jgi:hypothetical protein